MQATVVDLRYKMNDVLKALDRNERVEVLYRGKIKGVLISSTSSSKKSCKDHPMFGMLDPEKPIEEIMDELRGPRHAL